MQDDRDFWVPGVDSQLGHFVLGPQASSLTTVSGTPIFLLVNKSNLPLGIVEQIKRDSPCRV